MLLLLLNIFFVITTMTTTNILATTFFNIYGHGCAMTQPQHPFSPNLAKAKVALRCITLW